MEQIRNKIDLLYRENKLEEAYTYLLDCFEQAMIQKDDLLVLGILSELLGYYRVHAMFDLGNKMAKNALQLLNNMKMEDTIIAATTYLNIATLYRAQKHNQEAYDLFIKCMHIYNHTLDEQDERYIALYNNMSLALHELNDLDTALEYATKALSLLLESNTNQTYIAITKTNIAQVYFSMNNLDEGVLMLEGAIELFIQYDPTSPHYNAALASLAQSYYIQKDYTNSLRIYEDVMNNIQKKYGKNADYESVKSNYEFIKTHLNNRGFGMQLCFDYYQEFARPMLENNFPSLLEHMAIGLIGFGSECLGFDDELSRDHDFGPSFCIFLPKVIYDVHHKQLQAAYDQLPTTYQGYTRITSEQGHGRVGVLCIEDYVYSMIGTLDLSTINWFSFDESNVLALTNGELWLDHEGMLTKVRKTLQYYPSDVRLKKLVKSIAKMAQSGQYNYARCLARNDLVAANFALTEFMKETISCIYLLNKVYQPFYKWSYQGLRRLPILHELASDIQSLLIIENEDKIEVIENICIRIVKELQHQNLTTQHDAFLQEHVNGIMKLIKDKSIQRMHIMEG